MKYLSTLADTQHLWCVAKNNSGGSLFIIRFNCTAKDWLAHPELPIRLGFAIPLNRPNAAGAPDLEENEQLNHIEDVIRHTVASKVAGIHVLALTTDVVREFVFYINSGDDIGAIHSIIQQQVITHEVQCMAVKDPTWKTYKQFTPD